MTIRLTKTEMAVTSEAWLARASEFSRACERARGILMTKAAVAGSQAQVNGLAQNVAPCQMLGSVAFYALACGMKIL